MARPGLKKGQRHAGSFKPGFDPRRAVAQPVETYQGQSLLALCREYTVEAVQTLATCMRDEDASWSQRTIASTALLDRAWGRPANVLDVTMNERPSDLPQLTTADLQVIAAGQALPGEYEVIGDIEDAKTDG